MRLSNLFNRNQYKIKLDSVLPIPSFPYFEIKVDVLSSGISNLMKKKSENEAPKWIAAQEWEWEWEEEDLRNGRGSWLLGLSKLEGKITSSLFLGTSHNRMKMSG